MNSTESLSVQTSGNRDHVILLTGDAGGILFKFKLYLLIFIMILNFTGNALIIAIMTHAQRFKQSSFGVYFVLVAFADIGVGISGDLNAVLMRHGVNVEITSAFTCRLLAFTLSISQQMSGIGLSALSVDRCIAICLPYKSQVRARLCIENNLHILK